MSESILMALVQLFAIVAASGKKILTENARNILISYLQRHLNNPEQEEYLKLFDELLFFHQPEGEILPSPEDISQKITVICQKVNKELKQRDKIIVFLKFVEFLEEGYLSEKEADAVFHQNSFIYFNAIGSAFNLEHDELNDMLQFIFNPFEGSLRKQYLLIISPDAINDDIRRISRAMLDGQILILHLDSINTFIGRYQGKDNLDLNGHNIFPRRSFFFDNGDILKSSKIKPVYYSEIARYFLHAREQSEITFTANEIEYHFKKSKNGLQPLSFTAESGELIGVMGGSGVGKSTLLNILNGTIPPDQGKITVNGYDLQNDSALLQGSIGFVPQDDLLIEELTVYENLYYNAKLCFDGYSEEKLKEIVTRNLINIDLLESRDLKVGDPLNKTISGGQRKRLNIALELIRQPSILFADEPTSGLSSMDSEMVMTLLKGQTIKGRLVIVNIHQPSSDIFKLFDKLLIMDRGGYPVYYGNPIDALSYFKKIGNFVNPDESECLCCGYVNPEQILQIIEAKLVNESGKLTPKRKILPSEWYSHFRKKIQPQLEILDVKGEVPCCFLEIPGRFKQFRIFSKRNFLTKITNRPYLLINLLEAPLLAALLAFLTRYRGGDEYIFGDNRNLVAYLFMSVVVALFLGMMVSAEEIIRDRKLLKREAFLHLSRFSYLNSKIVFLFLLSAVQSLLYVIVGNMILGIHGMTFSFWLVLFSTSCVANMIGLNISAGLNSVVAIYIIIPFIIVPQLLLSGTVVSFDNLNPAISSQESVPVIGDVMTSRWSFEAMAVDQFKNNKYEKIFYPYDWKISDYSFETAFKIPYLQSTLNECNRDVQLKKNLSEIEDKLELFRNETRKLSDKAGFFVPPYAELTLHNLSEASITRTSLFLDSLSRHFSALLVNTSLKRDRVYENLVKSMGVAGVTALRQDNYNESMADLVQNRVAENKIVKKDNRLIRKKDPVFTFPESRYGRAQFYAPVKNLGSWKIDTFWFNTGILWIMSLLLYLALLSDLLRRIVTYFEKMKFRRRD